MPPKKKGGRTSNKKKNKGKAAASSTNNTTKSKTNNNSPLSSISNLVTFHAEKKKPTAKTGYYAAYKQATSNFRDWMQSALPNSKMKSVNDLKKGVDQALEHNIAILEGKSEPPPIVAPVAIMEDLSISIEFRQKVTNTQFATEANTAADEGHKYMVDVLKYCRSVLTFGRTVARVASAEQELHQDQDSKNQDAIGGRFSALTVEDDEMEQEEKQMESDIRARNFPTFTAPPTPKEEIDIEQVLINGDDRFQAMALLHTMDDLMGVVESHYALLKNVLRGQDSMHHAKSKIQLLMECAVAANMSTQAVQAAESELALSHPHLSSFYHVLALVFLPPMVAEVEKLMKQDKLREVPHAALEFVAEIMECAFHNRGDTRVASRVKRYAKKTGIKLKELEEEAQKILTVTAFEVVFAQHEQPFMHAAGVRPHSWFRHTAALGNDRCILNTQHLIQALLDLVSNNTKLVGRPGFWGAELEENRSPAKSIRGGLDETFAGYILPELIEICRQAPFNKLPETNQLVTVLDLLEQQMKGGDRTRPVPAALTFGLQAMLMSIFVLQGDGDLARIAKYTKESYNALFNQLEDASDPSNPPENAPIFYQNVNMFKQLVNFARPLKIQQDLRATVDPEKAEQLAFWNPLIGGEYMLYATYICSIGLGSATVDSMGQLRFVLHLYNALQQQDPQDIPILKDMDKIFGHTKAVWPSGRSESGAYCKSFWIAWGMNPAHATKLATESSGGIEHSLNTQQQQQQQKGTGYLRVLDEIHPEEYSKSYKCIVQQDFTDGEGVAEYTLNTATKRTRETFSGLFGVLTRVNISRDTMDEDEDFVTATNFTAVGCVLLKFLHAFSEHMGWDAILEKAMEKFPEYARTGKTMGGKKMKVGGFNASDLNTKQQGLATFWGDFLSKLDSNPNHPEVAKAMSFMREYFHGITKEQYTFFVETEDQIVARRRSPHEGSYPYGRTGRTPQDPLRGFLHFKYSKAGSPVVRVITPGKYTPFVVSPDGDIQTPYEEQGSKVPRGPSGKCRHIASYTVPELIALGWDGATYTATKGRHAARGHHVPFVCGYDSDTGDEYEPIDIAAGKRAGVIGIPEEELYMTIPDMRNDGRPQLMKIKNAR